MKVKAIRDWSRREARIKMNYYSSENDYSRYTHHVHHIDGNPLNNNISNLKILTVKEHLSLHALHRNKVKGFDPQFTKPIPTDHHCRYCNRMTINLKCLCGRTNP
jgi:hypothetical protein